MADTDTEWPAEAHGISIPLDPKGRPRLFAVADKVVGINVYERMTEEQVRAWIESPDGETDPQPAELDGKIP